MENHRPVTVVSRASKIFESNYSKINLCHVNDFLTTFCVYRMIFSSQYVHSSFIGKCKMSLNNKLYTGAFLINFSKPLDTINHELLIAKLNAYGFFKNVLKLCLVISLKGG